MVQRSGTVKRSRFSFFGETIAELKKVVWLTRREVAYLTFLVLVITVVVGLILGATDLGFTNLVNKFFLGG
jgi:preprotein translocase SecE subunit